MVKLFFRIALSVGVLQANGDSLDELLDCMTKTPLWDGLLLYKLPMEGNPRAGSYRFSKDENHGKSGCFSTLVAEHTRLAVCGKEVGKPTEAPAGKIWAARPKSFTVQVCVQLLMWCHSVVSPFIPKFCMRASMKV